MRATNTGIMHQEQSVNGLARVGAEYDHALKSSGGEQRIPFVRVSGLHVGRKEKTQNNHRQSPAHRLGDKLAFDVRQRQDGEKAAAFAKFRS
jgi:hypothetical protein